MCASPLEAPLDVLVIGAGPAGAASAALLHRAGKTVRVVEKQHFPRFVIGESLLPHCMDVLDAAGLLPAVEARGTCHVQPQPFVKASPKSKLQRSLPR